MALLNFDEVEEATASAPRKVLPKDDYEFLIIGAEDGVSQSKTALWALDLKVTEGEFSGCELKHKVYLSEKAMGNVKTFLKSIDKLEKGKAEYNCKEFIGSSFIGSVEIDEFEATDKETGKLVKNEDGTQKMIKTNKIIYAGYAQAQDTACGNMPF